MTACASHLPSPVSQNKGSADSRHFWSASYQAALTYMRHFGVNDVQTPEFVFSECRGRPTAVICRFMCLALVGQRVARLVVQPSGLRLLQEGGIARGGCDTLKESNSFEVRCLSIQCSAAEPRRQAQVEDLKEVGVRWIALEVVVLVHTTGESWRICHCPMLSKTPSSEASVPYRRQSTSYGMWLGWLAAMVITIGVLQHLATPGQMHWVYVLQRLYYIPTVLAGLVMGWRGGLVIALLAGCAFAIGTPPIWTLGRIDIVDELLELCMFCVVGLLSGVLTDRHRKQEAILRRTTDQLLQAHQELEKNFERMKRAERIYALAQLSAGLAHEIRTPLASLEGAASLVQRETQSVEQRREFLGIIQKESQRLNRLLTSFLEFAKPRPPELKRVDISELLDSVTILVQHACDASRLELRKQIEPDLPMLECDAEQLKQVLINLVLNACQAMPLGGTVLLEAQREGTNVDIDVHDQGGGIDEENMEKIFDPFFTTKESGTGLGLSVAHQIVSQHKGILTIARNSARGVTVRVSLPLRQCEI